MSYPLPGGVYDQVASQTQDLAFWSAVLPGSEARVLELGAGTGPLAPALCDRVREYHYDHPSQVVLHRLEYQKGSRGVKRCESRQRIYHPAELAGWLRGAGSGVFASSGITICPSCAPSPSGSSSKLLSEKL